MFQTWAFNTINVKATVGPRAEHYRHSGSVRFLDTGLVRVLIARVRVARQRVLVARGRDTVGDAAVDA